MPSTWDSMTTTERNAALAEKVMGWTPLTHPQHYWFKHTNTEAFAEAIWGSVGGYSGPDLSTTWGGMSLVVEAMAARDFRLSITFDTNEVYLLEFVHWDFSPYPLEPPLAEPASEPVKMAHPSQWPAATAEAAWRALGGE